MARPSTWVPLLATIRRTVERSSKSHYQAKDIKNLFELSARSSEFTFSARSAANFLTSLPTIPHGNSLLAQSTLITETNGGPIINAVDSLPFTDAVIPGLNTPAENIVTDPAFIAPYLNPPSSVIGLPSELDAKAIIRNPSVILLAAIKDQEIVHTTQIQVSTVAAEDSTGILNTSFGVRNANALQLDAIFWIETVQPTSGDPFLQLQYLQRVILDFPPSLNASIIHWPHFSVATLVKQ